MYDVTLIAPIVETYNAESALFLVLAMFLFRFTMIHKHEIMTRCILGLCGRTSENHMKVESDIWINWADVGKKENALLKKNQYTTKEFTKSCWHLENSCKKQLTSEYYL